MEFTPEEFMELHERISPKDVEIAQLKEQVAQLTKERDLWQARAMKGGGAATERVSGGNRFVLISKEKLKAVLAKINDVKLLSFVSFFLQKVVSSETSAEDSKALADMIPLPSQPQLTLTAEGDVKVQGDWNDVHDNEAVNL